MKKIFILLNIFVILSVSSCNTFDSVETEEDIMWTFELSMASDVKTRSGFGVDGFPSPEICDSLSYAVYYDDTLLFTDKDDFSTPVDFIGDKIFFYHKFSRSLDPSKIKAFFFAYKKSELDISADRNPNDNASLIVNYSDRYMQLNFNRVNSDYKPLINSYCAYIKLSDNPNTTTFKKNVVLKRPYASFNVLLGNVPFDDNIKCWFGFNYKGWDQSPEGTLAFPSKWYFDKSIISNPQIEANTYTFTNVDTQDCINDRSASNSIVNYSINGKTKEFFNCGYYFFLAPLNKGFYKDSKGNTVDEMMFYYTKQGYVYHYRHLFINFPSDGIKANNHYTIIQDYQSFDMSFSTIFDDIKKID